jgi:hypothetical protein
MTLPSPFLATLAAALLLYFRDGKLVQWGDIRVLDNMPESVQ